MIARDFMWKLIGDDPILNQLGLSRTNLFANWSGDSPASSYRRWAALRWGSAEAPVGRDSQTRAIPLGIWVYDREPDFTWITDVLWRIRKLMLEIAGYRIPGGGSILQADWALSSEDLRDEVMEAILRSETYRVVTDAI